MINNKIITISDLEVLNGRITDFCLAAMPNAKENRIEKAIYNILFQSFKEMKDVEENEKLNNFDNPMKSDYHEIE